MELYEETFWDHVNICNNPCSFVSMITKDSVQVKTKINGKLIDNSYVIISFNQNIKVWNAYYLYSGLSLIAEIGGYVGLFLGVSVNQVSVLMNAFLGKIDGVFN